MSNPLTKIIYDAYGVNGLEVYEKAKPKYLHLQEQLRSEAAEVTTDEEALRVIQSVNTREASIQAKILDRTEHLIV